MLKEMSLESFAQAVASRQSVPGGGSVSALAGSLAAALAAMMAALTLKKDAFADVHPLMETLGNEAGHLHRELLDAVDRDADSYREVLAAFRLPASTDGEKQVRSQAIQKAFRHASEVPLRVAELSARVMELAASAAESGNPDMVTDAGVGVLMARSAALGALMNVRINLASLTDPSVADSLGRRAQALQAQVLKREQEILQKLKI